MAALAFLAGVVGALLWLLPREKREKPDDARQLEQVVRHVLSRVGSPPAVFSWEEAEEGSRVLVVHVKPLKTFSVRRLRLELEAAFHNLGGELQELRLLEGGGYGQAGFWGRLGKATMRLVVLWEVTPTPIPRAKEETRHKGRLAVVLDDAGFSEELVTSLRRLPTQVAVAVLPNAPASQQVARALREQGRELLLHMPMEPQGNGGPGPGEGALLVGMSPSEVRARVEAALAKVGPVSGVNNHMGSRATSNPQLMASFMETLAGRGLYFLDSRTTPASVAAGVARKAGIPTLQRDVFLDVVEEEGAVRSALATAVSLARAKGHALAIGHVHPLTLRVLERELPKLADVTLVRPSALLP